MRTVYIVGSNMPGYLPDGDPYIVATKRGAISASWDDARRALESDYDLEPEYRGSLSGRAGDYWYSAGPGGGADYHYWIHPVTAELVTMSAELDSAYARYRQPRCQCCERELDDGERVYQIDGSDDSYVCRECI